MEATRGRNKDRLYRRRLGARLHVEGSQLVAAQCSIGVRPAVPRLDVLAVKRQGLRGNQGQGWVRRQAGQVAVRLAPSETAPQQARLLPSCSACVVSMPRQSAALPPPTLSAASTASSKRPSLSRAAAWLDSEVVQLGSASQARV